MAASALTDLARENLVRSVRAWRRYEYLDETNSLRWIRSRSAGDRPSLAALHARGLLERRVVREGRNPSDNSYEYRPSSALLAELDKANVTS